MSASRVNFISSVCSYAPDAYTPDTFLNLILKFMVTGFDPLPIESLTVENGVARVVTSEKNFSSVPGTKFNISGTGIPELDDRQEVQSVFLDGFTFKTEVADSLYTNGLTYSLAPLGWSLLQQDSEKLLLKSGSSGIEEFNLLIYPYNRTVEYKYRLAKIGYDATGFNDFKSGLPNTAIDTFAPLPINPYTQYNTKRTNYWLYGDDNFIVISATKYDSNGFDKFISYQRNSVFCAGEIKPMLGNTSYGMHFIQGATVGGISYPGGSYENSDYYSENFNTSLSGTQTSYFGTLITKNNFNSSSSIRAFSLALSSYYPDSGVSKVNTNDVVQPHLSISKFYIMDQATRTIQYGSMPGCYYLSSFIPELTNVPHISRELFIVNKKRNCLFVGASGVSGNTTTAVMLDLTGPIR